MKVIMLVIVAISLIAACSPVDKTVRKEAKAGLRNKPLYWAQSQRDSIVDYLVVYGNNYFTLSSSLLDKKGSREKAKVLSAVNTAGTFLQTKEGLLLSFYKDHRPAYIDSFLHYSNDKSSLFYYFNRDTTKKRELKIRPIKYR